MQLFFSTTSPYVRKCLVTAEEAGLGSRIQLLPAAAHPVQRDASIVARNPLGKVPTLVTDDGVALYDSRVICEYLDSLGGGRLFPREGAARWHALTLQSLADGILDAALLARYETALRPEALRWADWTAGQLDKVATSLASLDSGATALHDGADIGTIAVACSLGYLDLRFADMGWRGRYPRLAAWAAAFGQRPSMQKQWSL
ncbi:MAG: glutathione S-transferase [Aquabacterium sp.]